MYHYSPTTKGFYTPEVHGENIPADAVEITDAEYSALLDGQEVVLKKTGLPAATVFRWITSEDAPVKDAPVKDAPVEDVPVEERELS